MYANYGSRGVGRMNRLIKATQLWAIDKGLAEANPSAQYMKISEELGEVAQAYTRKQADELKMELGDLLVTIIIFAQQMDIDLEVALGMAYKKIADRKGKLVDGSFVKEEDLDE